MLGMTLGGRYAIVSQLGQGGMGAVYEARHTGTDRRVAVKVITADIGKDPQLLKRFEVEARAAGRLDSQHVAQVLDVGRDDATGSPFMVMEYLAGEDIAHLVERLGPLPPELALRAAAQTCLGLEKAHAAGIIHRDIKSANLFLAQRDGGERLIKILDFGIAKIKSDDIERTDQHISKQGNLTKTGALLGSPLYMSPEQVRSQRTIDHRTDLWSLGVVMYHMLTGRSPFSDVESLGDLLVVICLDTVPSVQIAAPWVDPRIATIVAKALQIVPAARYQSAAEMFEDLKALIPGPLMIDPSMLRSMSDEERAHIAPRARLPQEPRSRDGGTAAAAMTVTTAGSSADASLVGAHSAIAPASIQSALSRRARRALVLGAGGLLLAALAAASYRLATSPSASLTSPSIDISPAGAASPTAIADPPVALTALAPSAIADVSGSATPIVTPATPASASHLAASSVASAPRQPPGPRGSTAKPRSSIASTATATGTPPSAAATVSGRVIRTDLP